MRNPALDNTELHNIRLNTSKISRLNEAKYTPHGSEALHKHLKAHVFEAYSLASCLKHADMPSMVCTDYKLKISTSLTKALGVNMSEEAGTQNIWVSYAFQSYLSRIISVCISYKCLHGSACNNNFMHLKLISRNIKF